MSDEVPFLESPPGSGDEREPFEECVLDNSITDQDPSTPTPDYCPKITEQEAQLGLDANRAFSEKSLKQAQELFRTLAKLRPDDPLVQLNHSVVDYEAHSLSIDQLELNLKKIYNKLAIHVAGDLDDTEHFALYHNLAVTAFIKKQFIFTEKVLTRLWENLHGASEEASFAMKYVCPLLVATLLAQKKPYSAINVINEAFERSHPSGVGRTYPTSARATLDRALALVQSKQYKAFKRDVVKPSGGATRNSLTAYEFLRANLEFVKGNHRKATKLLVLGMQNSCGDQSIDVDGRTSPMYSNNLGCINVMLGKPNLGIFYLDRALGQHVACITDDVNVVEGENQDFKPVKKDRLLRVKTPEIVYNIGLALLHAGKPTKAFETFIRTVQCFATKPSLWLHLAECCVQCHQQPETLKLSKLLYGTSSNAAVSDPIAANVVNSAGAHAHRKLVLNPDRQGSQRAESETLESPTLEFANACLRNASQLLEALKDREDFFPSSNVNGGSNGKAAGGSAQSSPVKAPSVTRNALLKASVLLNRAYVCLRLCDPVMALEHAQNLLGLDNPVSFSLSAGYKMLGNLYAADALVQLDRISEAMAHLEPSRLNNVEVSFANVTSDVVDDVAGKSINESSTVSRAVFQHNVTVAFVLRGELDKAEELLDRLWNVPGDKNGMTANLITLRMYVALAKGNVEKCRRICRQNCALVPIEKSMIINNK